MKHCILVNFATNCYQNGSYIQVFIVLNKRITTDSNSLISFYVLSVTNLLSISTYTANVKRILE